MKMRFYLYLMTAAAVVCLLGCNVFAGLEPYTEQNENGFRAITLVAPRSATAGALTREMNRLSFGTSSRQVQTGTLPGTGTSADNPAISPWGCVIRDTDDPYDDEFKTLMNDRWGNDGQRRIQITAINENNNAGKIAGSEDGIAFYFWEVDADTNFRLSAEFYIDNYGFTRGRQNLNGQEAFGLMARDYVPQYEWNRGDGVNGNPPVSAPGDPRGWQMDMDYLKFVPWNGVYYTGYGRPDGPGGSSNMIMVGGVKRGARVYWRTGVFDDSETGRESITNPEYVANANFSKFYFLPREFVDYSPWGTGKTGIESRPDFPTAGLTYHLTLEKTNSGFNAVIVPPSGVGKGVTKDRQIADGAVLNYTDRELPFPDLLFEVEKTKYYVGFFASRDARVTISNIKYEESPASMMPARIDPKPEDITPVFAVLSPTAVSQPDYILYARSNVEGILTLSINGKTPEVYKGAWVTEATNASAEPFCLFEITDISLPLGDTVFNMVFTPDPKQPLSGYQNPTVSGFKITRISPMYSTFIVNRRNISTPDGIIWVAPNGRGTNAGTRTSPLDVATAISIVAPGQTIMLMDGIYSPLIQSAVINNVIKLPVRVTIPRYNSGRPNPDAPIDHTKAEETKRDDPAYKYYKFMIAENRGNAIFDFRKDWIDKGYDPRMFELHGDYWWIEGIHIRNTYDKNKGLTVFGSYNVLKWIKTYFNGDTGFQVSGRNNEPKSMWPMYNRIEFCESFGNADDARTDADGFAAKLTVGPGNVFYRCISHHNIDDGWDFFAKKETGPIGAAALIQCVAYSNGRYLNDQMARIYGDTNAAARDSTRAGGGGFKMGGEGIAVPHLAEDCLAFYNDGDGYTSNSDPAIRLTHCTSVNNGFRWRSSGMESTKQMNFTIYAAGSASSEGLDAVLTQIFSWWTADVELPGERDENGNFTGSGLKQLPPNDRLEPKSPASGYVWRRPIVSVNDESEDGRSVLTLYIDGKIPVGTNNYVDGRIMQAGDILSETPPFRNDAPFHYPGDYMPRIEGNFFDVYQGNGDGGSMAGLPKLNNFMKLQGIAGVVPGARGLW